jgi:tetratricopeptide (TPR) repeat protein
MRFVLIAAVLLFVPLWTVGRDHDEPDAGKAPLFDNLGRHHHPVSTESKDAQRYFDQGLTLCFAFNHPEAIRSFQEAVRLDPRCAMAHWGIAFAYGANINMPMSDEAVPKAHAALQKAQELAPKASPKEQAYIQALAKRYSDKPQKDLAPLDRAFADAMREVARQYSDDLDAATLYAEALMDTMPWNYWTEEGKPKPETEEILATLESVLRRQPDHFGACHYYIHAVEASPNPELGLAAAHRLAGLVPGAGHLVHMPSHIYLRLGNYHEASRCNERAIAVDEGYIARYRVKGMYPAMYFTHNIQFLAYSTSMEGRRADSVQAARKATAGITKMDIEHMPMTQWVKATPLYTLLRFGLWDEVLREPEPDPGWLYVSAMWHYARGTAFGRKNQLPEAEREATALDKIAQDKALEALELPNFPGASLVRIARTVLAAELAGLRGNQDARCAGLEEAVRLQDKLPYMEPPFWYMPIRQLEGAALVQLRRFPDAEKTYREDLRRHPENGWSLFGLLQCLRAEGKAEAAAEAEQRFREAWKHAEVTLTASSF